MGRFFLVAEEATLSSSIVIYPAQLGCTVAIENAVHAVFELVIPASSSSPGSMNTATNRGSQVQHDRSTATSFLYARRKTWLNTIDIECIAWAVLHRARETSAPMGIFERSHKWLPVSVTSSTGMLEHATCVTHFAYTVTHACSGWVSSLQRHYTHLPALHLACSDSLAPLCALPSCEDIPVADVSDWGPG